MIHYSPPQVFVPPPPPTSGNLPSRARQPRHARRGPGPPAPTSLDTALPFPRAPSTQPLFSTGKGSSKNSGSIDPGPNLAPGVASTTCFSTHQLTPHQVTLVSRVKATKPRISMQQIIPSQVTPIRWVNAMEAPALPQSSPQPGPMINSSTSNPIPIATPVIGGN